MAAALALAAGAGRHPHHEGRALVRPAHRRRRGRSDEHRQQRPLPRALGDALADGGLGRRLATQLARPRTGAGAPGGSLRPAARGARVHAPPSRALDPALAGSGLGAAGRALAPDPAPGGRRTGERVAGRDLSAPRAAASPGGPRRVAVSPRPLPQGHALPDRRGGAGLPGALRRPGRSRSRPPDWRETSRRRGPGGATTCTPCAPSVTATTRAGSTGRRAPRRALSSTGSGRRRRRCDSRSSSTKAALRSRRRRRASASSVWCPRPRPRRWTTWTAASRWSW